MGKTTNNKTERIVENWDFTQEFSLKILTNKRDTKHIMKISTSGDSHVKISEKYINSETPKQGDKDKEEQVFLILADMAEYLFFREKVITKHELFSKLISLIINTNVDKLIEKIKSASITEEEILMGELNTSTHN